MPCGKIFRCLRDLSLHRTNNPDCLERFDNFLLSLDTAYPSPSSGTEVENNPTIKAELVPDYMDTSDDRSTVEGGHPKISTEPPAEVPVPHSIPADIAEPSSLVEDIFKGAGRVVGTARSTFAQYRDALRSERKSRYHPFRSEGEWKLAVWLHESEISRAKMNEFLKLPSVRPVSDFRTYPNSIPGNCSPACFQEFGRCNQTFG